MLDGVLLQPEQEGLLVSLVEATRNLPRGQREQFIFAPTFGGSDIQHPGLPGHELPAYASDIEVLWNEGLLNGTRGQHGARLFDISPRGFTVYEAIKRRSGATAQQLWSSDSEQQLTMIGHLCREAMQAFATALIERYRPTTVDHNKGDDVARIRAVLNQ